MSRAVQDPCEYVLLCLVLLFCSDVTHLLRAGHSYNTQNKYAALLHRYLNKKWVTFNYLDNNLT